MENKYSINVLSREELDDGEHRKINIDISWYVYNDFKAIISSICQICGYDSDELYHIDDEIYITKGFALKASNANKDNGIYVHRYYSNVDEDYEYYSKVLDSNMNNAEHDNVVIKCKDRLYKILYDKVFVTTDEHDHLNNQRKYLNAIVTFIG